MPIIWIRIQNRKTLAVINSVNIYFNQVTYDIWGNDTNYKNYKLGTYPTEERAIEVLNDIQIAIERKIKVFQMPEE